MAARLNPRHVREPVLVETRTGASGWGDDFAKPQLTRATIDTTRKLVRDRNGQEVVSETTALLHPSITPQAEALFTPGSRVSVHGRRCEVISCRPVLSRGRLVYVEVTLT